MSFRGAGQTSLTEGSDFLSCSCLFGNIMRITLVFKLKSSSGKSVLSAFNDYNNFKCMNLRDVPPSSGGVGLL